MSNSFSQQILRALKDDKIVLFPTDGLPGLSFHPQSSLAQRRLARLKDRIAEKNYLSLCDSLQTALKFWQPLPKGISTKLEKVWPGPITVIWLANSGAPDQLRAPDQTLALRVGIYPEQFPWLLELLTLLQLPLPSTSVNRSGDPPLTNWQEASGFLETHLNPDEYFIPPPLLQNEQEIKHSRPSTIIKIEKSGTMTVLREGAFPVDLI